MDLPTFIKKWSRAELSEQAASQTHFNDLCALLGVKNPIELDPTGEVFTFERSVAVTGAASLGAKGDRGRADVWYKGKFVWEYKRKGKYADLADAYRQVNQYRDQLGNPPLLIVCDIARTEIHTNFTGFRPEVHTIDLAELDQPGKLDILRRVFTDSESFKPTETPEEVTKKVAVAIGAIAQGLRDRGHDPHDAAHFLMKVMFCLFAEDVELLPKKLFEDMLGKCRHNPPRLKSQMDTLFGAMKTGGDFGSDEIDYFNGGLFDDAVALELTEPEIGHLVIAASKDWSKVEPSVFGTLFERSLDPAKRAQIGAHYTSREDIMLVIEPVIVRPLIREWEATQAKIADQMERRTKATTDATKRKANNEIADLFDGFQQRLASVRVLDPACGSGNFLYVAIQSLLDLERAVIVAASDEAIGLGGLLPKVRPTQLYGVEISPYAAELAQVVIWIGYLQWMRDNGFAAPKNPVLEAIETIENRDAILAWADEQGEAIPTWREGAVCKGQAAWPEADFIVGNPPFLGGSLIWSGLGTDYREALWSTFEIPNFSDLCCYWFDIAGRSLLKRQDLRVGLLATQAIRGSTNRTVLESIIDVGQIVDAWSDLNWILDGAAVHISIVCFTSKTSEQAFLDGKPVPKIAPTLRPGIDISISEDLSENQRLAWIGTKKAGKFEIPATEAREILSESGNPNGRSNFDVISRWFQGRTVGGRPSGMWIIDYGTEMPLAEACQYERPFAISQERVRPAREKNKREAYRVIWWRHAECRSGMRAACRHLDRVIATPCHSRHRLFRWASSTELPDGGLFVFARSDDYFFGILNSSTHELWARRQGTQLREAESGFRYTPTTCFETFPLPWAPGAEPAEGDEHRPLHDAIADAARTLNEQRERWLNPPEWVAEIAEAIDAEDDFADVARVSGEDARRLIRQSAIDAASAKDARLKKRTLTNLYNARPAWLRLAHKALDEAVLAAYAAVDPAPDGQPDWSPAWAEVFEETGAGQPLPATPATDEDSEPTPHAMAERRAEVEQAILGNLLRMNLARASG